MTHTATASSGDAASSSRRGPLLRPMSRRRTALFLTVNFLAYAVANALVYYISSGRWYDTSFADYRQAVFQPLGQMLVTPLSIFAYPWMIPVTGLLVAVVVVVPILVTCLYHSRVCVFFLLCVAVLAHAPVLAIVLAGGCVAMAATTLRRRNPSLAMLLGLLPVFVYLYFSTGELPMVTKPMQNLMLHVPFLLAGVGAIVAGGVVLIIAHYTRYRPGVTWPVLVVLLATPTWVFFGKVGGDELAYAVLAGRLTPSEQLFADQEIEKFFPDEEFEDWGEGDRQWREQTLANVNADLAAQKSRLLAACDRFLRRYPGSPRRSAVLWIRGLAADTRVSTVAFEAEPGPVSNPNPDAEAEPALVHYYHTHSLPISKRTWERLREEHPGDPRAAEAYLRLAQLAIREERFDEAADLLAAGAEVVIEPRTDRQSDADEVSPPADESDSPWSGLFVPDPGRPSVAYLKNVSLEISKLRWLMEKNDVPADALSARALAAFLAVDRQGLSPSGYEEELLRLAKTYTHSNLADNVALAIAMNADSVTPTKATTQARRLARVRALKDMENEAAADASIEANYQLGLLALEARSFPDLSRYIERPEVYFGRVRDADERNPWRVLAEEHLARLAAEEGAEE